MNVNGARFHLLLGKDDWGRCMALTPDGKRLRLSAQWKRVVPPVDVPAWDVLRSRVTLAQLDADLPATPGEVTYSPADRRAGAADPAGNLYVVADDRSGIAVLSRGSGALSAFWPAPSPRRRAPAGSFADAAAQPVFTGPITGLAVTTENYLVAAARGRLLRFDLVGGGAPETVPMPPELADLLPTDIAPAACGGLWLLDGGGRCLFRLDRNLGFERAPAGVPAEAVFQTEGAPATRRDADRTLRPIALPGSGVALGLAALPQGEVVVLVVETSGDGPVSQLIHVDAAGDNQRLLALVEHPTYCLAARAAEGGAQVFLADVDGNQAHLVTLAGSGSGITAKVDPVTIPMRRFGGRGLVAQGQGGDYVFYDSGAESPLWVPLLAQRRQSFARGNVLVTPMFDSDEPQCTWDRIRFDGRIPAGTSVTIEARASDDPALIGAVAETGWVLQPRPYLNADGGELPGKRALAMPLTDRLAGSGSWDLLLQGATGRYLELRLTLNGDGRFTPSLRALRVWYPRFSWSERFLPGVYREEATAASFIERFLANMEGISTGIEGRMAAAQVLFDTHTAPAESLDWLATWYDMALDPRWSERQKRLFVRHAPVFFNWRGTIRGLQLALRIAADPSVDDADFALDDPPPPSPRGVRVIESFSARPPLRAYAVASGREGLPGVDGAAPVWSPQEGAIGLVRRWARVLDPATPDSAALDPLLDLAVRGEPAWPGFCLAQLGFVPMAGAAERARWLDYLAAAGGGVGETSLPQAPPEGVLAERWLAFVALPSRERSMWLRFLTERYRRIERLNPAWGTGWASLAEVPLPDVLPQSEAALRDWLAFEGQVLAMDRAAHRFSVLLPRTTTGQDFAAEQDMLAVAQRIVTIEKPAHTLFDLRFYWAMNRIGEARLNLDTRIGEGSRAPELVPPAVIGRAWLGASFTGGPDDPGPGRSLIQC